MAAARALARRGSRRWGRGSQARAAGQRQGSQAERELQEQRERGETTALGQDLAHHRSEIRGDLGRSVADVRNHLWAVLAGQRKHAPGDWVRVRHENAMMVPGERSACLLRVAAYDQVVVERLEGKNGWGQDLPERLEAH